MLISAAGYAILCLLASGALDLCFKFYSSKPRSRGLLICGIGIVWATLQVSVVVLSGEQFSWSPASIQFGLLAAVFVTVSNILLLEAMGMMPLSMASTIYRLNTVPLVLLAVVFLGEEFNVIKALGIAAALTAVLLLYQRSDKPVTQYSVIGPLLLVTVACCVRALYGFTTKLGLNNAGDANSMMLLAALGWIVGGLLYAALRERTVVPGKAVLGYVPVAGLLVFAVVWLLTQALRLGDASIVVPIANMGFIAAFVLSIAFRLERLNTRKVLAIGFASCAVYLLTAAG